MISRFFITCSVLCFSAIYTLKAQELVADFSFDDPADLLNNEVDGQPGGLFIESPTVGVCTNPETNEEGLCSSVIGDNFNVGIPSNLFTEVESITLEFDFFCQEEFARLINAGGATDASEQPIEKTFRIGYGAIQGFRIVYYTEADPTTPIESGFTDISITPGERAKLTFTYDKETGIAQFYKGNVLVWETPEVDNQRTPGAAFLLGPTNRTADGTEYLLIGEGMDGEASDIPSLYSFRMYDQACPTIDAPEVTSPVEICSSEKAILEASGATGDDEYYWYDRNQNNKLVQSGVSNTFETPELNETTTYFVEILRGPCRSTPEEIIVTVNPIPNAPSVAEPTPACEPSTFTLEATGGTDGNYQWYRDNDGVPELIPDANEDTYTTDVLPSGVTTFYVSITENGCLSDLTEASTIVRIPPDAPTADPVVVCQPGEVTLQVNDADEFTYRWYDQPTDGTLLAENDGAFTTTIDATTTFYVSAQSGGCESERVPLEVSLAERPEAPQSEDQVICEAGPVTFTATGDIDGNYRWYEENSETPIAGAVNGTFSPNATETTTYYVAVDDGICQSDLTPVTVTILSEAAPPQVDGPQSCTPTAFELVVNNAVAGSTYRWYTANGTTVLSEGPARYTTDVLSETTDYLVAQVVGDCEGATTLVRATVYPPVLPPTINPTLLCEPGEAVLQVNAPDDDMLYRWYRSPDDQMSPGMLAENDGTLRLDVADNTTLYVSAWNGTCESERTPVTVGILEAPTIDAGDDTRILPGDRVTLTAPAGFVQYQWSPSEGLDNPNIRQPTATPTQTTTYYLTVTTDQDCDITSTVTVAVAERLPIPNAFTPNADGLNDTWDIPFLRRYPQSQVLVYNRWGGLVFQSEPGYEKAWDGFYQGSVVPQGTYTYVLNLGNAQKPTRGTLTILQ